MRLSLYKSLHFIPSIAEREYRCDTMLQLKFEGGKENYNLIKRVTQRDFLNVLTYKGKRPERTSYGFIIFCRNSIMHLQQKVSILINVLQFL